MSRHRRSTQQSRSGFRNQFDLNIFLTVIIGVAAGAGIVLGVGFASGQLPLAPSPAKICIEGSNP